jgi:hypothetical protein
MSESYVTRKSSDILFSEMSCPFNLITIRENMVENMAILNLHAVTLIRIYLGLGSRIMI